VNIKCFRGTLSALFILIFSPLPSSQVSAQDFEAKLPETPQPFTSELEELPIEGGKINVKKLTEVMDAEAAKILDRISEIDGIVNTAYASKAAEIYGIDASEYDFLRRQAEVDNQPLRQFFSNDRYYRRSTVEEVYQYFNYAYDAINKNELWFGREDSLLAKDKALFNTMKSKVSSELATTPEGKKVLDLEAEKNRLLELLKNQKPLFEYLIERRKWWETYPDYENLVDQIEKENKLKLTP